MTEPAALAAPKNARFTVEQMCAAIVVKRGLVSAVAAHLRCDPETVRRYAKRYPTVAAALQEERERTTDVAEAALYQAISGGEAWAVCFYLKTQGKARGYVERTEQEHSGDVTIKIVYDHADADPAPALPGAGPD